MNWADIFIYLLFPTISMGVKCFACKETICKYQEDPVKSKEKCDIAYEWQRNGCYLFDKRVNGYIWERDLGCAIPPYGKDDPKDQGSCSVEHINDKTLWTECRCYDDYCNDPKTQGQLFKKAIASANDSGNVNIAAKDVAKFLKSKVWPPPKVVTVTAKPKTQTKNPTKSSSGGASCLTGDTNILTPNGQVKISSLRKGDEVISKHGESVKVFGAGKVYAFPNSYIYGFKIGVQEIPPFFTQIHTFLTTSGKIAVANKTALKKYNPQIETEFAVYQMPTSDFELLSFDNSSFVPKKISAMISSIVKDSMELYFLIVGGGGTYVANGFVCYHEMPNFEAWPETFHVIYETVKSVRNANSTSELTQNYDFHAFQQSFLIAVRITNLWKSFFESGKNEDILKCFQQHNNTGVRLHKKKDFQTALSEILEDERSFTMGMFLYSLAGKLLYENLDINDKDGSCLATIPKNFFEKQK